MSIAETIYEHVKTMPMAKAVEVLHFVEFLETKSDEIKDQAQTNELLDFIQNLAAGERTDAEIAGSFQALRDEWHPS